MIPAEKSLPPQPSHGVPSDEDALDGLATRLFDCALRLYFHVLSRLGELAWADESQPTALVSIVDRRRAG